MAAQIFGVPKEIKVPQIDFKNYNREVHENNIKEFITELTNHVKNLGYTGKYVGEVIHFPVADGRAEYMVFSIRPLMLIHLPIDDAWQYQYINRLTAADVIKKIEQQKALAEMFSKRKA